MSNPSISIVTVCRNGAEVIAETIESVACQGVDGVEHIVVDGNSTDGTLDVLARYPGLEVVSGSDGGVYDAMNRGIAMARGAVVGLVHGDDLLLPGALERVMDRFGARDCPDVVSCGTSVFSAAAGDLAHLLPGDRALSPESIAFGVPCLNARFFRRSLFERIGGFRDRFQPTADREFLFRLIRTGTRRAAIDEILHAYRFHDASGTLNRDPGTALWIWRKHLELTAALLGEDGWPPAIRTACRGWRAVEGAKLMARAARRGRMRELAGLLAELGASDPMWWSRLPRGLVAWRRWRGRHAGL